MIKNPWKFGDINEVIVKASDLGIPSIAKAFETIREIIRGLDAIDNETARREAARQASEKFHRDNANDQQQQ
jgi:hypothetical protein